MTDITSTNREISSLSIENIREYFNTYIKPFAPYREEKAYDTIINNLIEYYYHHTYINIPLELKKIFEESNIESSNIYDKLLVAIGVPLDIIKNISLHNKLIFLKSLSDFERYKGSILFFQKVCDSFQDKISVYELYIEYSQNGWILKPVPIYIQPSMSVYEEEIPYSTVYNSIPSLLLNEEQLNSLYAEEKLVLPIKSNLVLLHNDLSSDVSLLYNLIISIFLHTYKDNYLDVYFSDSVFPTQLKTLYFLWYYLITNYFDVTWSGFSPIHILQFIYSDIGFPSSVDFIPTTIDNLSQIIDRYNNIVIEHAANRDIDNTLQLRDDLYTDIANAFYTYSGANTVTLTEMYDALVIENFSLISYIQNRIDTSSYEKKQEINNILTEIYSSLLLYSSSYTDDNYFTLYVDYFLKSLPQILISPKKTTSYTILYNLKPYHVDLYNISNTGIYCQDKFNQIFYNDEKDLKFLYQLTLCNLFTIADELSFSFSLNLESPISILDSYLINFIFPILEDYTFIEDILISSLIEISSQVSKLEISSDNLFNIVYNSDDSFSIIANLNFNIGFIIEDSSILLDFDFLNCIDIVVVPFLDSFYISIDEYFQYLKTHNSDIICLDHCSSSGCFELYSIYLIYTGSSHTVGLKYDGTCVATGSNSHNQCDVSTWTDIVQISAGQLHTVGLKSDGTCVATGNNSYNQCDISTWTNIIKLYSGGNHTVGIYSDRTCVAIGYNYYNQCNVSTWTNIYQVSCGSSHTIGLKYDGTCVATGSNSHNQCDVSTWTDIVQISAGQLHTIGLKSDGTCVATGDNSYNQCDVSTWTDIVQISAGQLHTIGLKYDGTCVATGNNSYNQCDVSTWMNIKNISGGLSHTVGSYTSYDLTTLGKCIAVGDNSDNQCDVSSWGDEV